jgi:uncharacterized membrane protein
MLTDCAPTSRFIREVIRELDGDRSALILLTRSSYRRRQKALERLRPFLPTILQIDLPLDMEQELKEGLAWAMNDTDPDPAADRWGRNGSRRGKARPR